MFFSQVRSFIYLTFCITTCLSSGSDIIAQDSTYTSYLLIDSNFREYFLVDGTVAIKHKNRDLIPIKAGTNSLSIVTKWADNHRILFEALKDSIFIAKIYFNKINLKENESFKKLDDVDNLSLQQKLGLPGSDTLIIDRPLTNRRNTEVTERFFKIKYDDYSEDLFKSIPLAKNAYLKIKSNVDSVYVSIPSVYYQTQKIATNDSLKIRSGYHRMYISAPGANEEYISRFFKDSTTTTLNIDFIPSETKSEVIQDNIATFEIYNADVIIISDEDSEISINGSDKQNAVGFLNAREGPVQVNISNSNTYDLQLRTTLTNIPSSRAKVIYAYTRPTRYELRRKSFLPGASQSMKNEKFKSNLIKASLVTFSTLSIVSVLRFSSEEDEFNDILNRYNETTDLDAAFELGNRLDDLSNTLDVIETRRNLYYSITGAIFLYNMIDAWFIPPKFGYRKDYNIDFYLDTYQFQGSSVAGLGVSYGF